MAKLKCPEGKDYPLNIDLRDSSKIEELGLLGDD